MERVETTGSWWVFTEDLYLRLPKQEGPRIDWDGIPRPEWGQTPGPVLDGVWHKLKSWEYVHVDEDEYILLIFYDDDECIQEECPGFHFIRTGTVLSPIPDGVLNREHNGEVDR